MEAFNAAFDVAPPPTVTEQQVGLPLSLQDGPSNALPAAPTIRDVSPSVVSSPAEALFATVRDAIHRLLNARMKEADLATALGVSNAQAKAWLHRLVEEGSLEKQKKPAGYVVKQGRLF